MKFFTDLDFNESWLLRVVLISISISVDIHFDEYSVDCRPILLQYSVDNQTSTDGQSNNISVSS